MVFTMAGCPTPRVLAISVLLSLCVRAAGAQELTAEAVSGPLSQRRAFATHDDPAIGYSTPPFGDVVADLNRRLDGGQKLPFDAETGYLKSVLEALNLSTTSQLLVYSKTSVQAARIAPSNPRALYFSDDVVVGYIRGAPFLEFATVDPKKGVEFYTLEQRASPTPRLFRGDRACLQCHESLQSMDVPGMLLRSVPTQPGGQILPQLGNYVTTHASPIDQRWGGWYVTGSIERAEHMGNMLIRNARDADVKLASNDVLTSLEKRFDQRGYLTPLSDVAALLVFEHQMHMTNLLVRMGWDARYALAQPAGPANQKLSKTLLDNNARELVDYLLFVEEARLPGPVSPSAFASEFAARGPFDKKGRSLRQLDLKQRLLRYPCSYMIYSKAFDELPAEAKAAIYERLWAILSGQEAGTAYQPLSAADRRAVIEILRDTKTDLPAYFR
jgi:hypothetical protein